VKPGVKPAFADTGQQRWQKMAKDGKRQIETRQKERQRDVEKNAMKNAILPL